VLDDLIKRGLRRPELLIVDGGAGLESAIAAVWDRVPVQRCTVHKHRNLLAHAPERLHEEISADYKDMIYAATREEIETRRKAFIRKWRLKHRAVADSLEEAGDRLFTFTRLPPDQWRSVRTTDEINKSYVMTSPGTSRACSLVRPRRRCSSVPTAHFTAAAHRGGQGWPRFYAATEGLALIDPSTAACSNGSGVQGSRAGLETTGAARYCLRARATPWRRAAHRPRASSGSLIHVLPI
jgi:hypothetical protein